MAGVHPWNWTTFSLVQAKNPIMLSSSSNKIVGFDSNELQDVGPGGAVY